MRAEGELPRLVESAGLGDQSAWDALVARFTPLLWAVARGHGLPAAAAADVTHTTWLRLVESLDVAPADAVGEWVAAIARAESVQALRWVDPRPDRRPGPPDPVWAAVELLPARCRLALRGLATAPSPDDHELAAVLGLSPAEASAFAEDCLHRLSTALPDDDRRELPARLRAGNDDTPPAGLLAAARAAFSWRTLDTDLCRPSYDSLLDEALSPVRGGQDARLLRFESGRLALDLEVTAEGPDRVLVGQLTPSATAQVTIRHGGEVQTEVSSDSLGRFVFEGARSGPLSVRCSPVDGGGTLDTDWVLI